MLEKFIDKQRQAINYFLDRLDLKQTEKIIQLLLDCKGAIFFTGVGKSGLIAKKTAVTMISIGTLAHYLSPMDAVHGDLGMVTKDDVFIFLSKSGESDELLSLLPAIRNKGAKMVAVVCNDKSRLSVACELSITLPLLGELCSFDLVPTISTTIQLMFGDLLAIDLMDRKQFTKDDFVQNHPAGRIGKRLTMKVADLMITGDRLPLCSENHKLVDILVELSNKKCGCVLVVDPNKKLLGIFTDGDLRRSLQNYGAQVLERQMKDLMNSNPRSIPINTLAWDAMKYMEANQTHPIMVLPVLEQERTLVGLIKMHDIVQSGL